jgi:hypothetical protein
MASAPSLAPPPGAGGDSLQPSTPPTPDAGVSPPPQPSGMSEGSQLVIKIVQMLRSLAKMFPQAAPEVGDINTKMQQVGLKIMQSQHPGEPQAPPG